MMMNIVKTTVSYLTLGTGEVDEVPKLMKRTDFFIVILSDSYDDDHLHLDFVKLLAEYNPPSVRDYHRILLERCT